MVGQLLAIVAMVGLAIGVDAIHAQRTPAVTEFSAPDRAPRPAYAKALAMGFDAVLADFHWIQAVQLVGDPEVNPTDHAEHLGDVVDLVTTLDPWVGHPYRFAAVWMTESAELVRRANRLLDRAIEHHPDDWRNHFYKGFNYFFYLAENDLAADALEQAASMDGSPQYLGRLVARLRTQGADLASAEVFLRQLIHDTRDPQQAATYQAALDEIEIEKLALVIDKGREIYRRRNGRDIEKVEDLLAGPHPVFHTIPDPEPSSVPVSLRRGSRWQLGDDGRIVSTYYGRRYELHMHEGDRRRQRAMIEEESRLEAQQRRGEGEEKRDGG